MEHLMMMETIADEKTIPTISILTSSAICSSEALVMAPTMKKDCCYARETKATIN